MDRARAGGCSEEDLLFERHPHIIEDGNADGCKNCVTVDDSQKSSHSLALLAEVNKWHDKISDIGGREEYQCASRGGYTFGTRNLFLG